MLVTDGTLRNFNPDAGTSASASSTESGYPVDRTRNGVQGDKGWSNWVSTNKPAQSTLTYLYAAPHQVERVSVQFYRDGTTSWAQTMQVQVRGTDGTWVAGTRLGDRAARGLAGRRQRADGRGRRSRRSRRRACG